MSWKLWTRGLLAALIGGAAGGVAIVVVDPIHFNLFQGGIRQLGEVCAVFGIVAAAAYLKEHPVPDWVTAVISSTSDQEHSK